MKDYTISVVMATYNGAAYIRELFKVCTQCTYLAKIN